MFIRTARLVAALSATALLTCGAATSVSATPTEVTTNMAPGNDSFSTHPCADGRPGFSYTFIDPYWFFNKSDAQIRDLLQAQKLVGIHGIIMQWSAFRYSSGKLTTAYVASRPVGASTFVDALPKFLSIARELGLETWLGLVVAPGTLESDEAVNNQALLGSITEQTFAVANDLNLQFGGQFDGWYLPIEPDEITIRTPETAALQGDWIGTLSDHLHALNGLPVMSSPSMPRAIFDTKSPMTFVEDFAPVFERAHIDVWNFQDGFKMTAWTPQEEVAALVRAREIAAGYNAEVWADLYTPGPNESGVAQTSTESMLSYVTALGEAGFPLTSYMFSTHMNPNASGSGSSARAASYADYRAYCMG